MKSIKEKAEEWADMYPSCGMADKSFQVGANYVLGEIESLMKDVSDEYPRFQQGTIVHIRLIKLLEQLKK